MSDPERLPDLLRELPVHANAADPAPAARKAFDRAFGRAPAESTLVRALVPVGLLAVVGCYLLWAFNAAIALYQ